MRSADLFLTSSGPEPDVGLLPGALSLINMDVCVCVCVQVFIKRDGQKISLIVDGINAQSKRVPAGDWPGLTSGLYVGGVPSALRVKQTPQTASA